MKILGTGSYLPAHVVTNQGLIDRGLDTSHEWLMEKTGITERRCAIEETTSDMGFLAAQRALDAAGLRPDQLDLIILATTTPDMLIPSSACMIQKKLGAKNAAAFDVNNACSGFVYSLDIAHKFLVAGEHKRILVVGADRSTKITNPMDRLTAAFFSDGAGAVVVKKSDDIYFSHLAANGGEESISVPKGGSTDRFPKECDDDFYLTMNGKAIWSFATNRFPETVQILLKKAKLSIDDIRWIVPHQANANITIESAQKIGIPMERVINNIAKRGNTISATIPIALDEAVRENKIKENDLIIFAGYGAGLAWGGILTRYSKLGV